MARVRTHKSEEEWTVALERAVESYPGIKDIEWEALFTNDLDMVGRIIGDILKLQKAEENPHRRGRRTVPQIPVDKIWEMFEGFTTDPFPVALEKLCEGQTTRQVALRLNMSHMTLHRLKKGQVAPTVQVMEEIAAVFHKPPHYFLEYRAMYLANALQEKLINDPSLGVAIFKKLVKDST